MSTPIEKEVSPLDMSDEDFLNAPAPEDTVTEPEVEAEEVTTEENIAPIEAEEETPAEVTEEAPTEGEGAEEVADATEEKEKPVELTDTKIEGDKKPATEIKEPDGGITDAQYKEERERLFAPIKANGREIKINSVDEAISLIQMGANYNKKMEQMKPNLKTIKLLENNGLNDPVKLNYLIDLDKKDPEAILKLIKDSGIDLHELDIEAESKYTPKTRVVNENEIDLDTVLDEIQGTPTYNRTLDVVSKQWDGESKKAIANQPYILKTLNDQMESGIYDLINVEVERQRMHGGLKGESDIEAYRRVGEGIQASGGFDHLGSSQKQTPAAAPEVVVPKRKVEDPALKEKRKAAGTTREAPSGTPSNRDLNPLNMSDADFEKMSRP